MYIQIYTPEEAAEREAAQIRRALRQELTKLYSRMTAWIDDVLLPAFNMPLWATDYKTPRSKRNYRGRYEEAIDIFLAGGVKLPVEPGGCFVVASQSEPGEDYGVYLGDCVPYGPGYACACYDNTGHAGQDCAGVCKHILAAMVAYYIYNSLVLEGRERAA